MVRNRARNMSPDRFRVLTPAALMALALAGATPPARAQSAFAASVLDYRPAPGQFVQDPAFHAPPAALGPPVGGGTGDADDTKAVTLGGFGGYIVLAFDHTIADDPRHRLGLDCIVFGNAFWAGGNANRRWGEPATIEISRDANANGLADDAWYLIPGSHLAAPAQVWQHQTWDDNPDDPTYPPAYSWWVPYGEVGVWQTWGFRLPGEVFENTLTLDNPNGLSAEVEGIWGYADCSPTLRLGDLDGDDVVDDPERPPEAFYTVPDDPFRVGVDPGSGGGDAFDIAWAIDPATGLPAGLHGFDFVRITNATNVVLGPFGERSAEVCGVAEVGGGLRSTGGLSRLEPVSIRRR